MSRSEQIIVIVFVVFITAISPSAVFAAATDLDHITPTGYELVHGSYSNLSGLSYINNEYGMAAIVRFDTDFDAAGFSLPLKTRGDPAADGGDPEDVYGNLLFSLYPGMARAYSDDPDLIDFTNPVFENVSPTQFLFLEENLQGPHYSYEIFFPLPERKLEENTVYTLTIENPGTESQFEDGSYNPLCPEVWRTTNPIGQMCRYASLEDHGQGGDFQSPVFPQVCSSYHLSFAFYQSTQQAAPQPPPQAAPLFHPIVFIHGMGGRPSDWDAGGNKAGFKELVGEAWLALDPDFYYLDEWLHSYYYGEDENGVYNYQGDVRDVAAGLDGVVGELSAQHLAAGGDGRVDLVGFSLGGLVARQYLASKEIQGFDHHVRKVVTIGTPHLGSWLMGLKEGVDRFPGVGEWFEESLNTVIREAFLRVGEDTNQSLDVTSLAAQQVTPGSDYLMWLNVADQAPLGIAYTTALSDINLTLTQNIFGFDLEKSLGVGDGVVLPESAQLISGVTPNKLVYGESTTIPAYIRKYEGFAKLEIALPTWESLRFNHLNLPRQADVQEDVVEVLLE